MPAPATGVWAFDVVPHAVNVGAQGYALVVTGQVSELCPTDYNHDGFVNGIDFDDFVIWITLGIILGGRIGYVLFYNLPHFAENPIEILQLWNGGMSFHGGVLGCIVAIVLFAMRRGIPRTPTQCQGKVSTIMPTNQVQSCARINPMSWNARPVRCGHRS